MELSPGILLLAIIGVIFGFIISKSMNPGSFWIIFTTIGCGAAGIIFGNIAANR